MRQLYAMRTYAALIVLWFFAYNIHPTTPALAQVYGEGGSHPAPPECPRCPDPDPCPPAPKQCDPAICPALCLANDCDLIVRLYQQCLPPVTPTATPTITPTFTPRPPNYRWRAEPFGSCRWDLRGKKERVVKCIRVDTKQVVDDSLCKDTKPPTFQRCDICDSYPDAYISGRPGRQKHADNNGGISNLGDPSTQAFFWDSSPPASGLPKKGPLDNYFHDVAVASRVCREAFGSSKIFAVGGRDLYEHRNDTPLNNHQWYLSGSGWALDTQGRDIHIKGLDCKCP